MLIVWTYEPHTGHWQAGLDSFIWMSDYDEESSMSSGVADYPDSVLVDEPVSPGVEFSASTSVAFSNPTYPDPLLVEEPL